MFKKGQPEECHGVVERVLNDEGVLVWPGLIDVSLAFYTPNPNLSTIYTQFTP